MTYCVQEFKFKYLKYLQSGFVNKENGVIVRVNLFLSWKNIRLKYLQKYLFII